MRRYSFCMRSLVGLPQGKHFGHVKDYWECFVRWQNTVGHHALERVTRSRMVVSSRSSSNAFAIRIAPSGSLMWEAKSPTYFFHLSCQFTVIVMVDGAASGVTLLTRNR